MASMEVDDTELPNTHQASTQGEGAGDETPSQQPSTGALPKDEDYKVRLSEAQVSKLKQLYDGAAANSVIGRIHGRNPGLQGLKAWCSDNLDKTLLTVNMLGRGFFELEFTSTEGRHAALKQSFLGIGGQEMSFSPWIPHFSPESIEATRALKHPVWMQLLGLNRFLRQEEFLRAVASQIGEVLFIEDVDSYKGKTAGPRIRTLVQDVTALPEEVSLVGPDETVFQKIKVVYNGIQNQCNRCKGMGHYVKDCKQSQSNTGKKPIRQESTRQQQFKAGEGAQEKNHSMEKEDQKGGNHKTSNVRSQDGQALQQSERQGTQVQGDKEQGPEKMAKQIKATSMEAKDYAGEGAATTTTPSNHTVEEQRGSGERPTTRTTATPKEILGHHKK